MRMLVKTTVTGLLALIVTSPAAAHEWTESRFEANGETYVVRSAVDGDTTLLRGHIVETGRPFALRVRNGRVSGTVSGNPIAFRTNQVEQKIASR